MARVLAVVASGALLLGACASGDDQARDVVSAPRGDVGTTLDGPAVGGTWINPDLPPPEAPVGVVTVEFRNRSDEPASLRYATKNSGECQDNSWIVERDWAPSGSFPTLDPGDTGIAAMHTSSCKNPNESFPTQPHTSEGAFSVGASGAAQFQFALHFTDVDADFREFKWRGHYADGPLTGGLFLVECGADGGYLGTGDGGTTTDTDWHDRQSVCFDFLGPPPAIAEGQTCEANGGQLASCQLPYQFGEVSSNVDVTFANDSSGAAVLAFVGLHGDADQVTIDPQGTATVGLGAGHFGTLELSAEGPQPATLTVTSVSPS